MKHCGRTFGVLEVQDRATLLYLLRSPAAPATRGYRWGPLFFFNDAPAGASPAWAVFREEGGEIGQIRAEAPAFILAETVQAFLAWEETSSGREFPTWYHHSQGFPQ